MLEGLRGLAATGAGGRAIIVPRQVGAEVALTRSHLVYATRVELGEAHERIGLLRGAVRVSGEVKHHRLPFFQETVPTEEF